MSNAVIIVRLIGMFVACWVIPVLLCHFVGPAIGVLGALAAAALWYSQYRFPAQRQRSGPYFWFVASGYAFIGVTLVVCFSRLIGIRLL